MADKYDVEADSWYVWSKHVLLQLEQDSLYLYDIKKKYSNFIYGDLIIILRE